MTNRLAVFQNTLQAIVVCRVMTRSHDNSSVDLWHTRGKVPKFSWTKTNIDDIDTDRCQSLIQRILQRFAGISHVTTGRNFTDQTKMPDEGMREIFDKLLVDLFRVGATNIALAERLELIIHFAGFPDTAGLSSLMK